MVRARPKRVLVLVLAFLATTGTLSAQGDYVPPTLEDCDARARDRPDDPFAWYCFLQSVRANGRADEAVRLIEAHLSFRPDLLRARLNLAFIEDLRGSARATTLFREVLEDMEAAGDHYGVVYGGLHVAFRHGEAGTLDEADSELARAMRAAESIGDPEMTARVLVGQAIQANRRSDQGRAYRRFREAESLVPSDGPPELRCHILSGLAGLQWYYGDYRSAMETYRREAEIWREVGDVYGEAGPRYNIALMAWELTSVGELDEATARAYQDDALDLAVASGNRRMEAAVRTIVAQTLDGEDAIAEYERAIELSRAERDLQIELWAGRLLSQKRSQASAEHVPEAIRKSEDAVEASREAGDRFEEARSLLGRAYLEVRYGHREDAIRWHAEAIEAVERIRGLQAEESARARVFARWDYAYHRLAGFLLRTMHRSPTPEDDLDLAFRTMERLRARVLLESLESGGAATSSRDTPLHAERAEVRRSISHVQRGLMDPELSSDERVESLRELESLEVEEAELRDRIARDDPLFSALHEPAIPSLSGLREVLGDDHALLSFQVSPSVSGILGGREEYGDAWLLAITGNETTVIEIPAWRVLAGRVEIFEGLLFNRDGSEARAAVRLYEDLLEQAIESLPDGVRNLVIVPDGVLHRIPFEVLRADPDAEPVAMSFRISYAPSATVWLRWRNEAASGSGRPRVFALADPDVASRTTSDPRRAADPWLEGLRLGPLPHARREARMLGRRVGAGSMVLEGTDATERLVKTTDLGSYGILHFAAHAVVDERHPERCAILLVPGAEDEDGLLQFQEIADLDLDGQIVILSACRSASGRILQGEGVQGLARAFFRAGSPAVLGSLWPLRDDDAAGFVDRFSRHLARGLSLAESAAEARRDRIRDGAPAMAWAGLVVLGDGDLVPVPGGRPWWSRFGGAFVGIALAAALAMVAALAYRARR